MIASLPSITERYELTITLIFSVSALFARNAPERGVLIRRVGASTYWGAGLSLLGSAFCVKLWNVTTGMDFGDSSSSEDSSVRVELEEGGVMVSVRALGSNCAEA